MIRFALVINHDKTPIERVVRADELRLEVYGEAPNRSKQRIVAWRDTILFPTRLVYHRDHLGIVAHDFGSTIRLGDGDEVRDVPHPLSPRGLEFYQFKLGAPVRLAAAGGEVRVRAVEVRPRWADSAAAVGTLYLDVDRGALVRFSFSFTSAAYRDPTVAAISVTLDNALIDGQLWLPWHQSLLIRRGDPVLGLPLGSTLRAEWDITDYQLGIDRPPGLSTGAGIAGLAAPGSGTWPTPFPLDAAALGPAPALDQIVVQAQRLLVAGRTNGLPRLTWLGADGLSGLIQANRVSGVRVGSNATLALGAGGQLHLAAGWGSADHRLSGGINLAWQRGATTWQVDLDRGLIDLADRPRVSGVTNTLRSLIDGADLGDWRLRDRLALTASHSGAVGQVVGALSWERHRSVDARLGDAPVANPPLGYGDVAVVALRLTPRLAPQWHLAAEHGEGDASWSRIAVRGEAGLPAGLVVTAGGGVASAGAPTAREFVTGGWGTLPGLADRSIGGRRLIWARLARPIALGWSVPGPRAWGGRLPLVRDIAPFVAAARAGGDDPAAPWRAVRRWNVVAGIGMTLGDPLLRVEWGWSPRDGRMQLTVDADRLWWPLL